MSSVLKKRMQFAEKSSCAHCAANITDFTTCTFTAPLTHALLPAWIFFPKNIYTYDPLYSICWFLTWLPLVLLLCFTKSPTVFCLPTSMVYAFHVLFRSIIAGINIQEMHKYLSGPFTTLCSFFHGSCCLYQLLIIAQILLTFMVLHVQSMPLFVNSLYTVTHTFTYVCPYVTHITLLLWYCFGLQGLLNLSPSKTTKSYVWIIIGWYILLLAAPPKSVAYRVYCRFATRVKRGVTR